MAPSAIPRIKEAVRAVRESDARRLAEHCLSLRTCDEIVRFVRQELPEAAAASSKEPGQQSRTRALD
jgi:phosphoenolpyruvate-protein kinase (PTS system EI component)